MLWLPLDAVVGQEPAPVASAQRSTLEPSFDAPAQLEGVLVVARRGAASQAPEREFGDGAIDALGAADIGEVVERLNRAAGGSGAPIIIVNGRRIADPGVFLGFPPDALTRVEILPPSSSATYGDAAPSRRVINIVLQKRFEGRDALASTARSGAGGVAIDIGDLRRTGIHDMNTRQIGAGFTRETSLRAGERPDFIDEHPGTEATTLRPQSELFSADFTVTRAIGEWRSSFAANLQRQSTRFLAQIDGQGAQNRSTRRSANLTGGLNGEVSGWAVRASGGLRAFTTKASGMGAARSENQTANLNWAASRNVLQLPAGWLSTELSGQLSRSWYSSEDILKRNHLGRSDDIGAQISAPILSASRDGKDQLAWIGDVTVSLKGTVRSTDVGRAGSLDAGLFWTPDRIINLIGGWQRSTEIPPEAQRYAPTTYAQPSVVFDFRNGQAAEVSSLVGGNPDLRNARREVRTIGLSLGPVTSRRLSLGLTYSRNDVTNESGSFPEPTAIVEAAFSDRFKRDVNGRLVVIDRRPVNIAASTTDVLASNLGAFLPLSAAGAGSIQLSLNHIWRLSDSTLIRAGLPRADRLAGDAGGAPRHELAARLDGRRGPWGVNASANWRSRYRIRSEVGVDGPGDLVVGALGTLNLQLNYAIERHRPAGESDGAATPARRSAGMTLSLEVDNLFNARPRARLGDGRRAPGYGRDDRDPIGRLVRIALKGRF